MSTFSMHPAIEDAIQQIDAALFNGDTFDDSENRAYLKDFIERWLRRIEEDSSMDDQKLLTDEP